MRTSLILFPLLFIALTQGALAQTTCREGTSEVVAALPNGTTKALCLPVRAVEALEAAPGTQDGGPVLEVTDCPCDFSRSFAEKLDWDRTQMRCEDQTTDPANTDIFFALTDWPPGTGLGPNRLAVTGGTFSKGNICTADVTIGGIFYPSFQDRRSLTDAEVIACTKDLSNLAETYMVPNGCN